MSNEQNQWFSVEPSRLYGNEMKIYRDGQYLVSLRSIGDILDTAELAEFARRVAACLNACAGIETFMLEMLLENQRTVLQDLDELTKQRDELLEALKEIEWSNDETWRRDRARAAIAKATGEQP